MRAVGWMRLFGDRFGWVLARVSTALTVSNWLKQVTLATLAPLVQFNHDAVIDPLGAPRLPQLTKSASSSAHDNVRESGRPPI